ncbi:MAG: antitoxin HicB [Bacteroidales bacterium]|jgi:predicted RNase H-like HicB family nuclease|nr:antitoxin HicB [Bacteroidales bacterium]MBN2748515.1 antitoxin HicB [Bacteroidales bacterium]MDX9854901.1 antitoxin HicB [Tenuifilaceae bacterium]HPX05599.1 antitoxin HicB [Tenuifilaceae bacterium]HQB78522.1 antitoxin HicB [Tenuifilaceae bacterium]
MKKLRIIIERGNDLFAAYAENCEGVYGEGYSVEEAKASALKGLEFLVNNNDPKNLPSILNSEYEIVYRFDVESFLNYYRGIFTNAALERITGINQRQIQHYASGESKPRRQQIEKIQEGLHRLGQELTALEL